LGLLPLLRPAWMCSLVCASSARILDATEARELHRFAGDNDGEGWEGRDEAASFFFYNEAGIAKLRGVLPCEFVVGDESDASRFEDADDLLQGFAAGWLIVDVVNAEVGDDYVEGSVWEGHLLCGLAKEGAVVGDAFEVEVALGGGGRVATHIYVRPHVDAGGVAGAGAGERRDPFGGSREEKASAAAYVEDVFVSTPWVQAEHEIAVAELADLDVKQEEKSFGKEKACGPIEAASIQIDGADVENGRREDGHQQKGRADEKEVAHDGGCIYAVVGFV
jgi:hypothetical protein